MCCKIELFLDLYYPSKKKGNSLYGLVCAYLVWKNMTRHYQRKSAASLFPALCWSRLQISLSWARDQFVSVCYRLVPWENISIYAGLQFNLQVSTAPASSDLNLTHHRIQGSNWKNEAFLLVWPGSALETEYTEHAAKTQMCVIWSVTPDSSGGAGTQCWYEHVQTPHKHTGSRWVVPLRLIKWFEIIINRAV